MERYKKESISLQEKLTIVNKECPFVGFNGASCLITTLRRMKMQEELDIPVENRTGHAISVENGKCTNEMTLDEWQKFYGDLKGELKKWYPEVHEKMFGAGGRI